MLSKKGAMFGLDARIALAIFGALSVISGAALYSAIKDARVVSAVNQLDELSKAYVAHFLDTGEHLSEYLVSPNFLLGKELVENSQSLVGWSGPYWTAGYGSNYNSSDTLGRIAFQPYNAASFLQATNNDWGAFSGATTAETCTVTNCHVWAYVEFRDDESIELAKSINEKIDMDNDGGKGKVRVREFGDGTYNIYYYVQPKQ